MYENDYYRTFALSLYDSNQDLIVVSFRGTHNIVNGFYYLKAITTEY